jgi:hypothetical protein
MAGGLLLFGCVAGVLCTEALVASIREEHEVVQLAQVGCTSKDSNTGLKSNTRTKGGRAIYNNPWLQAPPATFAQELVREETKAAVAVQTEQKAKQVAEAVRTVARAAREVDAAQVEAIGQAATLAQVTPRG